MAFLSSMDISASGLTAQRLRMDVISENVANIDVTRNAEGQPYRRRYVLFQEKGAPRFSDTLNTSIKGSAGAGVRVTGIYDDTETPFKLEYDPAHADADEFGYVRKPNVDIAKEMVDYMSATRSYEANITILNGTKSMAMSALQIGK